MSGPLFPGEFSPLTTATGTYQRVGVNSLTTMASILATAGITGLAATGLPYPHYVLLQAEIQNIRWMDDGTAPTATRGFILGATADPLGFNGDILALQFIAATAGAFLNVGFYRANIAG